MSNNKSRTNVVCWGFALLVSACLLRCVEAQVPPPDPTTQAAQSQRGTDDSKQNDQAPTASSAADATRGEERTKPAAQRSESTDDDADETPSKLTGWAAIFSSVAWPVAAVLLLYRLLKAPQIELLLTKLAHGTTRISVAGLEIKLSDGAEATLEDLQKLIKQVPATHGDWVSNSHLDVQFHLVVSGLQAYLGQTSGPFGKPITQKGFGKFRFTLHVPDVLLTHSVRQLVDYLGSDSGGRGRPFSARRGIVGLAWRLEESQFAPQAYTEDQLVRIWGMTRVEAKNTVSTARGTLIAVLIKNQQGIPLAVFYGDARDSDLFDSATIGTKAPDAAFKLLADEITRLCDHHGLTNSLQDLENARVKVKQLDIYRQ